MRPIRNYQKHKNKQKTLGAINETKWARHTRNKPEIMEIWAEWIQLQFQTPTDKETPPIAHIDEQTWGGIEAVGNTPAATHLVKDIHTT